MSIWSLAYSALARAASASARARAAARLAAELLDRRDAADLHSDLTSSCESCEVSPWLDMFCCRWSEVSQDPGSELDV